MHFNGPVHTSASRRMCERTLRLPLRMNGIAEYYVNMLKNNFRPAVRCRIMLQCVQPTRQDVYGRLQTEAAEQLRSLSSILRGRRKHRLPCEFTKLFRVQR